MKKYIIIEDLTKREPQNPKFAATTLDCFVCPVEMEGDDNEGTVRCKGPDRIYEIDRSWIFDTVKEAREGLITMFENMKVATDNHINWLREKNKEEKE